MEDEINEIKPDSPVAQKQGQYIAFANGEFWVDTGKIWYRVGYVMNPYDEGSFETAINHEEEVRVLFEQAREEFGFS